MSVDFVVDEGTVRSLERELERRAARIAELEKALRCSAGSYHHEKHVIGYGHRGTLEQCSSPVCQDSVTALLVTPPTHERNP